MKHRIVIGITLSILLWTGAAFAAIIDLTLDETADGADKSNFVGPNPKNPLVGGILILTEQNLMSDVVIFDTGIRPNLPPIPESASLRSDADNEKDGNDVGVQGVELTQAQLQTLITNFTALFPNAEKISISENALITDGGYTPAASKPGYFQTANGDTPRWVIKSDLPEPSTVFLLGVALAGLLGFGWRGKKQAA